MKKSSSFLKAAAIILTVIFTACKADIITLPDAVTLGVNYITLSPGESLTLTAKVTPDEATNKTITWYSSDPEVVKVVDGMVTAIKEGKAAIIVTTKSGQKTETCMVTVTYSVFGFALDKVSTLLPAGQNIRLNETITPNDAPDKTVSWESSNPDIASVADGVVTAKTPGTAIISVVSEVGAKTAKCTVKVVPENYQFLSLTFQPSVSLSLLMSGDGEVNIAWDDESDYDTSMLSDRPSYYLHSYAFGSPPKTITIAGENITSWYCNTYQITNLNLSNCTTLTSLTCSNSLLTSLDLSNNTALTTLICFNNLLTSLDLSFNPALIELNCSGNSLTSLDMNNNTALTVLNCSDNRLTNLRVSECTALVTLNCSYNLLTNLDISNNVTMLNLNCINNQIANLDVFRNSALVNLNCENNQLTSLDVSKNIALTSFCCDNNPMNSLNVSNTELISFGINNSTMGSITVSGNAMLRNVYLQRSQITNVVMRDNAVLTNFDCRWNQFTDLMISGNTMLTYFNFGGNQLVNMNLSDAAMSGLNFRNNQITNLVINYNDALENIICYGTQLTSLDVSNNPALSTLDCCDNQLESLNVSNNIALSILSCYSNRLTSLDLNDNIALTLLICSNNQFSAEALNALFGTLHDNAANMENKRIDIRLNPGTNTCDQSIVTKKGWIVDANFLNF